MGLHVPYQTLSPDSLNLTAKEMNALVAFMQSLTDTVGLTSAPAALPIFNHDPKLNKRTVGDRY
jgi:cytochrome c peroxidase